MIEMWLALILAGIGTVIMLAILYMMWYVIIEEEKEDGND